MREASRNLQLRFLAAGACWGAVLLVILRSPVGERAIVVPFAAAHAALAFGVSGGSPVTVDLSCSGSDVIALSMAAILAYPVGWRRRLSAVALAVAWLASLNLVRIITLMHTAGTPLFMPLHLYVWPAVLMAAAAGFVFTWIWLADRSERATSERVHRRRSLVIATALLVVAYAALNPWLLQAEALHGAAMSLANGAAAVLQSFGINVVVGGSTLVVAQQSFLITPECIITPLMPVYLAWALVWPSGRRAKIAAVALFAPLFTALSFLRLLTIALPAVIGPPLVLTHGFYQLLMALVLIVLAARWQPDASETPASHRVAWALLTVAAVALLVARPYTSLIDAAARALRGGASALATSSPEVVNLQGAIAIMPGYQVTLLCGLCVAWFGRRAWRSLSVLVPAAALLQIAFLVIADESAARLSTEIPTTIVRAISILAPCVLVLAAAARARRRATRPSALVESRA